jgi:hypothetical protein
VATISVASFAFATDRGTDESLSAGDFETESLVGN